MAENWDLLRQNYRKHKKRAVWSKASLIFLRKRGFALAKMILNLREWLLIHDIYPGLNKFGLFYYYYSFLWIFRFFFSFLQIFANLQNPTLIFYGATSFPGTFLATLNNVIEIVCILKTIYEWADIFATRILTLKTAIKYET